jgi:hypothetical protein
MEKENFGWEIIGSSMMTYGRIPTRHHAFDPYCDQFPEALPSAAPTAGEPAPRVARSPGVLPLAESVSNSGTTVERSCACADVRVDTSKDRHRY